MQYDASQWSHISKSSRTDQVETERSLNHMSTARTIDNGEQFTVTSKINK